MNLKGNSFPEYVSNRLIWGFVFLFASIPTLTYLVTWGMFVLRQVDQKSGGIPPIVPYTLPFLGSAISFARNPAKCVSGAM